MLPPPSTVQENEGGDITPSTFSSQGERDAARRGQAGPRHIRRGGFKAGSAELEGALHKPTRLGVEGQGMARTSG